MRDKYSYLISKIEDQLDEKEINELRKYFIHHDFDLARFISINNQVKKLNNYDKDNNYW